MKQWGNGPAWGDRSRFQGGWEGAVQKITLEPDHGKLWVLTEKKEKPLSKGEGFILRSSEEPLTDFENGDW